MTVYTVGTTQVPGSKPSIVQTLNMVFYASFELPNNNQYRALVDTDQDVSIKMGPREVFTGTLCDPEYHDDKIVCRCLDKVINKMSDKLFSGNYSKVSAATILAAICAAAGVTAGVCPTTQVSVRFKNATCAHAAITLAKMVNKDWYTIGTTFAIGDRGSSKGTIELTLGTHKVQRSKKRDYVLYEGYDEDGNEISATAGTGSRRVRFLSKTARDEDTLQNMADQKLAELNQETQTFPATMNPVVFLNSTLEVGDTATVDEKLKAITGSFRIAKITIEEANIALEIARTELTSEELLAQADIVSEELGVYPNPAAVADKVWEESSDALVMDLATTIINDSTASGAKCAQRLAAGASGTVWTGPYEAIGAGEFYALFTLNVASISSSSTILTLQVYSGTGGGAIATRDISPDMFLGNYQWTTFAVKFRVNANWIDVQLRGVSFVNGITDLCMDWVGVCSADTPLAGTGISVDTEDPGSAADTYDPGTTTQPIGQGTVAAGAYSSATAITVANTTWTTLLTFYPTDVDMECYFMHMHVGYNIVGSEPTTSFNVSIRVYDVTDGIYYPIDSSSNNDQLKGWFRAVGHDEGTMLFFCKLPRDVGGHTLQIQLRHNEGSAQDFAVYATCWGDPKHTHTITGDSHPHTVSGDSHSHTETDPWHDH